MFPLPAGQGNIAKYVIKVGEATEPLAREVDYLTVEAVTWFINRQSSWLENWSASGAMSIKLDDASEEYRIAMGAFELSGGLEPHPFLTGQFSPSAPTEAAP